MLKHCPLKRVRHGMGHGEDGWLATEVTKEYYENNVNWFTHDKDLGEESDQQTTLTMDRSGRVLRTKL